VGSLAVDLDPVITVFLGPGDHLAKWKGLPAIPEAKVGNAVKSQFHFDSSLSICSNIKAYSLRPNELIRVCRNQ
jgi:hypothetical protein